MYVLCPVFLQLRWGFLLLGWLIVCHPVLRRNHERNVRNRYEYTTMLRFGIIGGELAVLSRTSSCSTVCQYIITWTCERHVENLVLSHSTLWSQFVRTDQHSSAPVVNSQHVAHQKGKLVLRQHMDVVDPFHFEGTWKEELPKKNASSSWNPWACYIYTVTTNQLNMLSSHCSSWLLFAPGCPPWRDFSEYFICFYQIEVKPEVGTEVS